MNTFPIPEKWLNERIRIIVAGAGGTGSQVIDQLASLDTLMRALGHPGFDVSLHDHDTVSRWNLGRQRFAAPDVGLNKAVVLIHRINMFYGVDYSAVPARLDVNNASRCDLLVTCTDSATFRGKIGKKYRNASTETLWLDFGNGNAGGQVELGHLGKPRTAEKLPNVVDLFPALDGMEEPDDQPSCSMEEAVRKQPWPTNRAVAIAGITLLERLMRVGSLSTHGATIQIAPYTVTPMPIDPVSWAMYGYAPPTRRRRKVKRTAAHA